MTFTRMLAKSLAFEGDPKSGPPPGPGIAATGMFTPESADVSAGNILMLSEADPKSGPPPTDNFYPEQTRYQSALLDVPRFALALGLATALLFLVISLIVALSGAGHVLAFLELILPGFNANAIMGLVIGTLEMFLIGFFLGLCLALLYNSLMRHHLREHESWEVLG